MKNKTKVTKTLNPLHFEDLEPHRFEDLIRQLIYDFRDWQNIEATGRGGSDEGFDVRAWEKITEVTNKDEEDNEGSITTEGNLWMIQCKREKELGPSRIKEIINDNIDKKHSPYGYILVAPANFSKNAYDTFREELRSKKVMDFHLWGKAELEDMLSLPKNDHILFTFFGISLITKRRSRTSEIKFAINNKNKLLRVLSNGQQAQNMHESVLIRDFKDIHYPWKNEYKDFDKFPRWQEHISFSYHPIGLFIHSYEYYAYVDIHKKEYDFTKVVNLINNQKKVDRKDEIHNDLYNKVEDFWKHLPRKNQAKFIFDGIIPFEDMLVIDDKGDVKYDFPHIFIEFGLHHRMFKSGLEFVKINNQNIYIHDEEYKRIRFFPSAFPIIKKGRVYKNKSINLENETLRLFKVGNGIIDTLFDIEGRYNFLKPRDIILVSDAEHKDEKKYLEITYKYTITVKKYLTEKNNSVARGDIERQVGRSIKNNDTLNVYEIVKVYEWQIPKK